MGKVTHVYENFSSEVFPGFYESPLYDSNMLYNFSEAMSDDKYQDWDFTPEGWKKYVNQTCMAWVETLKKSFIRNPLEIEIGELAGLDSPREYNFRTDRISFQITYDDTKLEDFVFNQMKDDFNQYLHEHWSSYDGFVSFVPNNIEDFLEEYYEDPEPLLDIILEWYIRVYADLNWVEEEVAGTAFERLAECTAPVDVDERA